MNRIQRSDKNSIALGLFPVSFISLIILASVFFVTIILDFTTTHFTSMRQLGQMIKYVSIFLLGAIALSTCVLPCWFLARDLCIKKWLQFVFNECHDRAEFTRGIDNREAFEAFLTQVDSAETTYPGQRNDSITHSA